MKRTDFEREKRIEINDLQFKIENLTRRIAVANGSIASLEGEIERMEIELVESSYLLKLVEQETFEEHVLDLAFDQVKDQRAEERAG